MFAHAVRVCFVESRGTFKKAPKNCPILESKSNIECVIGTDRLDCLRRISKGTAHFGVFSPEDLIAAKWAGVDVLVTSEMRFKDGEFSTFYMSIRMILMVALPFRTVSVRSSCRCRK